MKHIKQIIFDADDTLWANNIYYIKATNKFIDLVHKIGLDRKQIQTDFDQLELNVVRERGYGSRNFVYILETLYEKYQSHNGHNLDPHRFQKIVAKFRKHPNSKPATFSKVLSTLRYLKANYKLYILTKGEFEEQQRKILYSGISKFIDDYFIRNEKNDQVYKELISEYDWNVSETCMVGNSPKSDINPALRAGMFAIYIPYPYTWKLDLEPIQTSNDRFMQIKTFSDLRNIF